MAGKGGPAIGIDLGTMYSCVGVWQGSHVEIIANDHGSRTTPSCVAFSDTEILIGNAACNQGGMNPDNTVFSKYIRLCFLPFLQLLFNFYSSKHSYSDVKSPRKCFSLFICI